MEQNLFDPAAIKELRTLDPDNQAGLVNSLIQMFFDSAESTTQQLLAAARSNDCETLASLAHTLRSTSGNLGAVAFSEICNQLEQIATYEKKRIPTDGVSLCRKLGEILVPTMEALANEKS
jgi:HPt (histidine-containing phosphotransfer) domain-containing protein